MSSPNQDISAAKWHDRAGASAGEYRKSLTSLSTGSLAVFFLALTTKLEPGLSDIQRVALVFALLAMAVSVLLGVTAWYADAQWAYAKGEAINPTPKKEGNWVARAKKWHDRKTACDQLVPFSFMLGIIAATLYIFSRIIS